MNIDGRQQSAGLGGPTVFKPLPLVGLPCERFQSSDRCAGCLPFPIRSFPFHFLNFGTVLGVELLAFGFGDCPQFTFWNLVLFSDGSACVPFRFAFF